MANPDYELRCCVCGYSLAGCGGDAACPTCSAPAMRSRQWAERAAGVIPSPAATRRCFAALAALEAGLVLALVVTEVFIRSKSPGPTGEMQSEDVMDYVGMGVWSAAMGAAACAAGSLTRGLAKKRAWATVLVFIVGAAMMAASLVGRYLGKSGWPSVGESVPFVCMAVALLASSVGAILMHEIASAVADAVPDAARRSIRWLSFFASVGQSVWIAAAVFDLLNARGIPVWLASMVIWAIGTALSSVRGWVLFAAIRRWTVRASRPPSVATPPAG